MFIRLLQARHQHEASHLDRRWEVSRDIMLLAPEVRIKALETIRLCANLGLDIKIYYTLRSCEQQAELYRQSRPYDVILRKQQSLTDKGYSFLAGILESVGPQSGPHVTNAGPGESWHNYGEAFDAVPILSGTAMWNDEKLFEIYGAAVRHVGMSWGGDWTNLVDRPHAQRAAAKNPLNNLSPDAARERLERLGSL